MIFKHLEKPRPLSIKTIQAWGDSKGSIQGPKKESGASLTCTGVAEHKVQGHCAMNYHTHPIHLHPYSIMAVGLDDDAEAA